MEEAGKLQQSISQEEQAQKALEEPEEQSLEDQQPLQFCVLCKQPVPKHMRMNG